MATLRLSRPRPRVTARPRLEDQAPSTSRNGSGRAAPHGLAAAPADPSSGWTRILRVAVLSGASLGLAALAHLLGGGELPSLALSLPLLLAIGTVAALVTARRCRLPILLALLGVGQLILHLLFQAGSRTLGGAGATGPHAGHELCPAGIALPSIIDANQQPHAWLMLAGHVLATTLTAWLLARGEAALWRLAERFLRATRSSLTPWPRSAARDRVLGTRPVLPSFFAPDDAAPRGPPCWLAAAA